MPATETIRVDAVVRSWLNVLADTQEKSYSEIIKMALREKFPTIEETARRAEEKKKRLIREAAKDLGESNGNDDKTPSPDEG